VEHADHVTLIRAGVPTADGGDGATWADIGAGTGAFTLALADLLGSAARIVAVDRDAAALRDNARSMAAQFPAVELETVAGDLTGPLHLPILDGLLAANVLHFIDPRRRVTVVAALATHLRPRGRLLIVEYETSRPTPWLPYPLPFVEWERLAAGAGLTGIERVGGHPDASGGGMYASIARAA
jgi:SAM-dependent methyltransferase